MTYPIDETSAAFLPFVGSMSSVNPVADADDLYLSRSGITLRRWKNKAGTEFYDELLVPFSPGPFTDNNAPMGGTGVGYPVYEAALGGLVTVAVAPGSVAEDGAPNLVFTFTRNTNSTGPLEVTYAISGTATNGTDYETIGTTVSFNPGETTATVVVNPTVDANVEANETVILTIQASPNYTIGSPASATGTITNDDV